MKYMGIFGFPILEAGKWERSWEPVFVYWVLGSAAVKSRKQQNIYKNTRLTEYDVLHESQVVVRIVIEKNT